MSALDDLLSYIRTRHGLITPEESEAWIMDSARRHRKGQTPCLVTFDDGFASNVDAANEVLDSHNAKAIFFVCPGLLDRPLELQENAVREYVRPPVVAIPALMTWDQVRSLRAKGHTVGCHSFLHRKLSTLSSQELIEDIELSADRLASELSGSIHWYAYPFGDVKSISTEALGAIGRRFKFCCSGVRGLNTRATHALAIWRDNVDLSASPCYQHLIVDGGLDLLYVRKRKLLRSLLPVHP